MDGVVLGTEVNCFSQSDYTTNVVGFDAKTGKAKWDQLVSWSIDSYVGDKGVFVVSGICHPSARCPITSWWPVAGSS